MRTMREHTLWLGTVLSRISAFLFASIVVLTGFFFMGNLQEFSDGTQVMLLKMMDVFSLIYIIVAPMTLISMVVEGIKLRMFYIGKFVLTIVGIILIAGLYFFTNFLTSWLEKI